MDGTEYPESEALATWTEDGLVLSIVEQRLAGMAPFLCGYVRFPARPLEGVGYAGFGDWIPVHGGVTYAHAGADGSYAYGFDCAHSGDEDDPKFRDVEWVAGECRNLARAIRVGQDFEAAYDAAPDNEGRADVVDAYHEACRAQGIPFDVRDNFSAMLHVIFGTA